MAPRPNKPRGSKPGTQSWPLGERLLIGAVVANVVVFGVVIMGALSDAQLL